MTLERRLSVLALITITFATNFSNRSFSSGQSRTRGDETITVRLSVEKSRFHVGEAVPLRVELINTGKKRIFIGQEMPQIEDWIYSVHITVKDDAGRVSPQLVLGPPFVLPSDPKEDFSTAVIKKWTVLPPGYSYGSTLTIDGQSHSFLMKPGRYEIQATYVSMGMDSRMYYNRLSQSPEELARLPFKSWKGRVNSNCISIDVVRLEKPRGNRH